jgi:hypothetical protein
MLRAALLSLVVVSVVPLPVRAQHSVVVGHSPGPAAAPRLVWHSASTPPAGRPGFQNQSFSGRGIFPEFHSRRRHFAFTYLYPYFDPFADDSYLAEPPPPEPVLIQQPVTQVPAPQSAAKPQIIEFPASGNLATPKKQVPTVFILTNGERLESRQFLITANNLSVTLDRRQQVIPLDRVDVDATLSANRERGLDLRIPSDRNEITLSF